MRRVLTVVFWIFLVLWIAASAIFLIGTFGLFGAEPDPLSAAFLIPLGLPWNKVLGAFDRDGYGILGVLAPAINLAIIWLLRGWTRR